MGPNNETPHTVANPETFRCKNCRQILFKTYVHGDSECSSYFIDQPSWIDINDMENEIKFKCFKCQTKIG